VKRAKIVIVVALIAGFFIGYFASSLYFFIFKSSTEQKIKTFYELVLPGSSAEVMSLKEESGLYKVLVKITSAGSVSYQEGYLTKDGKLLSMSDSTILVETSVKQIEKQKIFVKCLKDKDVRIFGINNQTVPGGVATILQLNILGRIYSPEIFINCDGQLAQQCINAGISQVPSVVVGGNIETGVKTIDWFESKTGCKL
jgi:hypothetical protein